MAAPVIYLAEAERDMADLFDYIAEDSGLDRAEFVLRRIHATASALADWPGIGRIHRELDGKPRGFSVSPWLIIYEPREGDVGIVVWRVVDARRDVSALIRRPRRS